MAVTWGVIACDYAKSLSSKADVITNVHWEATDKETVDTSDLSSFIAYASVTEANAIAWAKAALGSDEVTRIETDVTAQITESKTPTSGSGTPWS